MTIEIDRVTWFQTYRPNFRHGWVGEPEIGQQLGYTQVSVRIEDGDAFHFLGWRFTSSVSFFKYVFHGIEPEYVFKTTSVGRDIEESDIPEDILAAFDSDDAENFSW